MVEVSQSVQARQAHCQVMEDVPGKGYGAAGGAFLTLIMGAEILAACLLDIAAEKRVRPDYGPRLAATQCHILRRRRFVLGVHQS